VNPTDELISRKQFIAELGISDSTERRARAGTHDWPPHLCIRKKLYYRRSAVDDFLRRQEALCNAGLSSSADRKLIDESTMAAHHLAKELAAEVSPLNLQQIALMKFLLACLAEVNGDE
jgi:hypothetical protein